MTGYGSPEHFQRVVSDHVVSLHGTCRCGTYVGTDAPEYRRHVARVWSPHTLPEGWMGTETRTVHSVTIPGHGLFRAYGDDVERIRATWLNGIPADTARRAMLSDVNEIAAPEDYSDVSTSALVIILASFTPGSSSL